MFERVFVEEAVFDHPQTKHILTTLNKTAELIEKVEDYWGRSKKPYLQKRDNLNLYIGKKLGAKVKEAPPAYGLGNEKHYYFIHAYNCIYECQYCYLQGYFNTPDIVLFVNHDEIIQEMKEVMLKHPNETVWFHAGEFSDSLALSHLTLELNFYHQFLQEFPQAKIELRTKSVNIKPLLTLNPLPNLYVTFSLAPTQMVKSFDLKTPGATARIKAMQSLAEAGFRLGLHLDPIIYRPDYRELYEELAQTLVEAKVISAIDYVSLGVVRFTKDVYHEVEKNYPDSELLGQTMIKSFDNKIRYPKPMRYQILKTIKNLLRVAGIEQSKIYLCMEETDETAQS